MILTYEFIYISKNNVIDNFLDNIAKNSDIDYLIQKEKETIFLHVNADEDKILAFSDALSKMLPISIFIKDMKVYTNDEFFKGDSNIKTCEIFLPFTPKALNEARKNFNPFIKNEIGKNLEITPILILACKNKKKEFTQNYKEAFFEFARIVKNEGGNIKTPNGVFFVSIINEKNYKNIDSDFFIMPTDLSVVQKIFIAKEEELTSLVSLEKPKINLKINAVFSSKNTYMQKIAKVGLADNLFMSLLNEILFDEKIDALFVSKERKDFATFCFQEKVDESEIFEIVVLDNGAKLIVSGYNFISKKSLENIRKFNSKAHTSFVSNIQENELFDKSTCGIFLSKNSDDLIMLYSQQTGMLDFVSFEFEKSIEKIFKIIENQDENGNKLIKNYAKKYENLFLHVKTFTLEEEYSNLYNLFGIIALIIGIDDNFHKAREKLFSNVAFFGGIKGPRFDFKLEDENSFKTKFDAIKLIRSAISYKIAEVDENIISFGLIESLSFFISDLADNYKESFEISHVAFNGLLFGEKTFSNLCVKNLSKNHNVVFNKELPIEIR